MIRAGVPSRDEDQHNIALAPTFFKRKQYPKKCSTAMASRKARSSSADQSKSQALEKVTEDDSSLAAWLDKGADVNAKNSE